MNSAKTATGSTASSTLIYTAITADFDRPRSDIQVFSEYSAFRDSRRNAKIYKVLPHMFLSTEWSIWVDGNIVVHASVDELLSLAQGHEIAVFRHPWRDCIYDEAEECIRAGLDDERIIRGQINRYLRDGYPQKNGLAACGVIIRRHTPRINRLCEQWWAEICAGSVRDQISFPYVFREYFQIDADIFLNPWVSRHGHSAKVPSLITRTATAVRGRIVGAKRCVSNAFLNLTHCARRASDNGGQADF